VEALRLSKQASPVQEGTFFLSWNNFLAKLNIPYQNTALLAQRRYLNAAPETTEKLLRSVRPANDWEFLAKSHDIERGDRTETSPTIRHLDTAANPKQEKNYNPSS
jgi:hypothetical protein